MIEFPELTINPDAKNFRHSLLINPIRRVHFQCGAVLTRPIFTDIPVRRNIYYPIMSNADKETLELWEICVSCGETEFQWYNTENKKTYLTLLMAPIEYALISESSLNLWRINIHVITLRESYLIGFIACVSTFLANLST